VPRKARSDKINETIAAAEPVWRGYPTRSWDRDALTQPQSRARFSLLKEEGWLDSLRKHSQQRIYTYWDYKRQRWEKNGGLRLDHLLLNEPLHRRLRSAGVDKNERGKEGASDHAPTWIELKLSKS